MFVVFLYCCSLVIVCICHLCVVYGLCLLVCLCAVFFVVICVCVFCVCLGMCALMLFVFYMCVLDCFGGPSFMLLRPLCFVVFFAIVFDC